MPITDEMVEAALDAHERTAGSRRDLMRAALAAAYPLVVAECAAVAEANGLEDAFAEHEGRADHGETIRDAILALAQQETDR